MTPAEHYAEAERLLKWRPSPGDSMDEVWHRSRVALVHATLAVSTRPIVINVGDADVTPEFMDGLQAALRGEFE